jgi:hypothetical protein
MAQQVARMAAAGELDGLVVEVPGAQDPSRAAQAFAPQDGGCEDEGCCPGDEGPKHDHPHNHGGGSSGDDGDASGQHGEGRGGGQHEERFEEGEEDDDGGPAGAWVSAVARALRGVAALDACVTVMGAAELLGGLQGLGLASADGAGGSAGGEVEGEDGCEAVGPPRHASEVVLDQVRGAAGCASQRGARAPLFLSVFLVMRTLVTSSTSGCMALWHVWCW